MSHMDRALSLARRALGSVSPNPAVGALVVKDGAVIGEGWNRPPGQDHAEVVALRQAGPDAKGATLFTTLEPCCHHGRTPPCTDAIIGAGIAEVRTALIDPNPLVNGGGIARLRSAGVRTECGDRAEQAAELIEAYIKFITTGIPFVTAKFAMTLDGKIATRTGESKWITSAEARSWAQGMRAVTDVIMVGVNTVLADDPRLTARDEAGAALSRQPLRVVVDGEGRTPPSACLLSQRGEDGGGGLRRGGGAAQEPGGRGSGGRAAAPGRRNGGPRRAAPAAGGAGEDERARGGRRGRSWERCSTRGWSTRSPRSSRR